MSTNSTDTVSALDDHIGFWMRRVSNHVSSRFRKLIEAKGVSVTEWVALRALLNHNGASHAGLIETLGMTKGAASKLVSRLEEKGLLERRLVPGRAREQQIALTAAGRRLVPKLAALADQNDEHCFGHLDPKARAALMTLLQDLARVHQLNEIPVA